jgi:hypothetical protein
MGNDKSILEKLTDKMKNIANIAAEAANHALSAEQPALKADDQVVAYMPLAADGFVSDPMMIAPIAPAPEKRVAPKRTAKKPGKKSAKKSDKSASKTAGKDTVRKSRKAAKKSARKAQKKTGKK